MVSLQVLWAGVTDALSRVFDSRTPVCFSGATGPDSPGHHLQAILERVASAHHQLLAIVIIAAKAAKTANFPRRYSRANLKYVKSTAMAAKHTISQIVRLHREVAQLTRLELSMLAGVGKTVIFDIEHGKESIRFDTLCRVLSALNVSLHYDSPVLRELDK